MTRLGIFHQDSTFDATIGSMPSMRIMQAQPSYRSLSRLRRSPPLSLSGLSVLRTCQRYLPFEYCHWTRCCSASFILPTMLYPRPMETGPYDRNDGANDLPTRSWPARARLAPAGPPLIDSLISEHRFNSDRHGWIPILLLLNLALHTERRNEALAGIPRVLRTRTCESAVWLKR